MTENESKIIRDEIAPDFVAQLRKELAADEAEPQGLLLLAFVGCLRDAPVEAFTESGLLQTEDYGITCLHHAARNGEMQYLPQKFLSLRYLTICDHFGNTILHDAAKFGHLDQIPEEILSLENLKKPNKWGYCPLQLAAENGFLDQVPSEMRTPEHLHAAASMRTRIFSTAGDAKVHPNLESFTDTVAPLTHAELVAQGLDDPALESKRTSEELWEVLGLDQTVDEDPSAE